MASFNAQFEQQLGFPDPFSWTFHRCEVKPEQAKAAPLWVVFGGCLSWPLWGDLMIFWAIYLEKSIEHTHIHTYIYNIYMIYDICMKIWHTWKVWVCLSWALRLEGFFVIPKPCCTSGGNAMVSADWLRFCESILSLKDWTSSGDGIGTWNWFRLLGLLVSPWPSSSPGSRYRLAFGRRTPQNGLVWK